MTSVPKLSWKFDQWTTYCSSSDDELFLQAVEALKAPTKLLHTENYVECIQNGLLRLSRTDKAHPDPVARRQRFWQGILKAMPKTCQGELESIARRLENMNACPYQPVMFIEWRQCMFHLKGFQYSRHMSETDAFKYFDPLKSAMQTLKWKYEDKKDPLIMPDMHYAQPWMQPFMEYLTSKSPQVRPMVEWARDHNTQANQLDRITKYLALYQTGSSLSIERLNASLFKVFVDKQKISSARLTDFKFFDTILYAMSYNPEHKQAFLDGVTPLFELWDRSKDTYKDRYEVQPIPSWIMAHRHYTTDMQKVSPAEVWATQTIDAKRKQLLEALLYLMNNIVSDKKELTRQMIPLLQHFQPWTSQEIHRVTQTPAVRRGIQSYSQAVLTITQAEYNYELLEAFDPRIAVAQSMSNKNWFGVWKDMVEATPDVAIQLPTDITDAMQI